MTLASHTKDFNLLYFKQSLYNVASNISSIKKKKIQKKSN